MACIPAEQLGGAVPAGVACAVCGGAASNAVRTRSCGHVLGMQCALRALLDTERCPKCGAAADCGEVAPCEKTRDAVAVLTVSCPDAPRCAWVGSAREQAEHRGSDACGVPRVVCPFCGKTFEKGPEFEAHKDVCDEQFAVCDACKADMPRRELKAHKCPKPKDLCLRDLRPSAAAASNAAEAAQAHVEQPRPRSPSPTELPPRAPPSRPSSRAPSQERRRFAPSPPAHPPLSPVEPPALARRRSGSFSEATPSPSPVAASQASQPPPSDASTTIVPCPFTALGCDAMHEVPFDGDEDDLCVATASAALASQPALLAKHLNLMCGAFAALQKRCNSLEDEVARLKSGPGPAERTLPPRRHRSSSAPRKRDATPTKTPKPAKEAKDTKEAKAKADSMEKKSRSAAEAKEAETKPKASESVESTERATAWKETTASDPTVRDDARRATQALLSSKRASVVLDALAREERPLSARDPPKPRVIAPAVPGPGGDRRGSSV